MKCLIINLIGNLLVIHESRIKSNKFQMNMDLRYLYYPQNNLENNPQFSQIFPQEEELNTKKILNQEIENKKTNFKNTYIQKIKKHFSNHIESI